MSVLRFYHMLVMAELFAAEFLIMLRLRKRNYFMLRFMLCAVAGLGVAAALPPVNNVFYTAFTFLLLFFLTLPILKLCCNENWVNVFFCGIASYTMQHFAYGTANFLLTLIQQGASPIMGMYFDGTIDFSVFNLSTLLYALVYVTAYFVSYTGIYMIFVKRIRRGEDFRIKSYTVMILAGVALFVDIFINAVVVYFSEETDMVLMLVSNIYENICCFFLLYIQFGLVKTGSLKNELSVTQLLLREKERQYNLSKDSIELINLKCHDLKHQIRTIGEKKELPAEAVKEIENAISIYDAEIHTDNEILDIILTEKNLKCAYNGIALTCVADGHSLEFMDKTDVYSLFGNALDNAIEAVMRLEKPQRNVGVIVKSVGEIVSVNVYNSFGGELEFDAEGFPQTSKSDKNFHGIGLKSIRQIAEKYNGICSVKSANGIFTLNVLISKNNRKGL